MKIRTVVKGAVKYFGLAVVFSLLLSFIMSMSLKLFPELINGAPGMNVFSQALFFSSVIFLIWLVFRIRVRSMLTVALVVLSAIPVMSAIGFLFTFVSWLLNPSFFGVKAKIVISYCVDVKEGYRCAGTMISPQRESSIGSVEYPSRLSFGDTITGTYYEDKAWMSGQFVPGGRPPEVDPLYAILASLAIIVPIVALVAVTWWNHKRNRKGWFWEVEESILNLESVRSVLVVFGALLFILGIFAFSALMFQDLKRVDGDVGAPAKLLEMGSGDYLTLAGIGLTLMTAVAALPDYRGVRLFNPGSRLHRDFLHLEWTGSLFVFTLSAIVISMRLSDPSKHNLIPLPLRSEWERLVPTLRVLEVSFSWSNMLGIIALSLTLVLLSFSQIRYIDSFSAAGEGVDWRKLQESLRVISNRPEMTMRILDLKQLNDDGGVTKSFLVKMRLVKESSGNVTLTKLGRESIGVHPSPERVS